MSSYSPKHRRAAGEQPVAGTAVTLRYHEQTKHSYTSVRREAYTLDWANQPSPYKQYLEAERLSLPQEVSGDLPPTLELLRRLAEPGSSAPCRPAGLGELSTLCQLGYGITAQKVYPGLVYDLRAAPSAGALFPCELYVALRGVEGVADGVYHYAPADHSLGCLRRGDFLPVLQAAAGGHPALAGANLIFVISAIWWRSSWKYRQRAYRYCLHDTGHLAGNLLLAGKALGYRPALVYDFVDGEVNRLLGLEVQREAALALVACCSGEPAAPSPAPPPLPAIAPACRPLSPQEVTYPLILDTHAATCLSDVQALAAARRGVLVQTVLAGGEAQPSFLLPDPTAAASAQPLPETIARRRSSRSFVCQSVSPVALSALLAATAAGYPGDLAAPPPLEVAVIVNAVEGIAPGAYRYDAAHHRLLQVREGDLRSWAAYLSLEQQLCGNAAAVIFLLADLEKLAARGGERAYRRTLIEAGLRGEFIYLVSRALGLGCSGIGAFYDDQVVEFFEAAPGTAVIYELAVGMESPDGRIVECNS
ncbi:MAG: SagB/ThcOx family dehydrogenase [Anaerolineae bacterium]|nr:SagB/ThcOx family dehydrogenase [Anaerolineae bacterium]